MKIKTIIFTIFSIGIFVFGIYSVFSVFRVGKLKPVYEYAEKQKIENKIGGSVEIPKLAPLNLSVNGKLKDRQTIVENLKEKIRTNQSPVKNFDGTGDVEDEDALITEFIQRCGQLSEKDFVGHFPPTAEEIISLLGQPSC